ncbi:AAA family ATPase [Pendulispora albinea]|uniref:AAA family ATPase n=1 Tax=Pendulispora albinea TaxID=2741071 RepID=A0ABZ2M9G4_9BACT
MATLRIRNFAHLADVSIDLGDLTILVGPQGTGKSLALQWLKVALDGKQIVSALRDAGQNVSTPGFLIDLIFGVGMGPAWNGSTSVSFDKTRIRPQSIGKLGRGKEKVFFIPAHRAMLISDGWAAPFQKLTAETPVVARLFSQNLFDRFSARGGNELFPLNRVLKEGYRKLIDDAVFHGGKVGVEEDSQHAKRLRLTHASTHGPMQLPFMTWTAGQREFTPLLLGLYHLLPSRRMLKQSDIQYVVIEEPEMGLHPQAVTVFMLLVLDLLWRGYKVVLSTHSPIVLTVGWMLRRMRETRARWQLVCDAFEVEKRGDLKKVAEAALTKTVRTHFLKFESDGRVYSKDVSTLDPDSEDEDISGWGGLTGFTSRFGEAVRRAANEEPSK